MNVNLFTYGVLMYEELTTLLTGKSFVSIPGVLMNHQRLTLNKKNWSEIAVVIEKERTLVNGYVLMNIDLDSLQIFDKFEQIESDLYRRTSSVAILDSGEAVDVEVYLGGSLTVGCLSGEWVESEFIHKYYQEYKDRIIPEFLGAV